MSFASPSRILAVRYALHNSNLERTRDTTPAINGGTLYPLQITDDGASMLPRAREFIPRKLRSLQGRQFTAVRGGKDVSAITLATEFKGVNSNTGGAVSDWSAKMEQGYLLEAAFGSIAPTTTGAAATVAASGHSTTTLNTSDGTNYSAGQVIAFGTDEGIRVGLIASKATNVLTLQHAYDGTPTTGATIYRLATWTQDDDLVDHSHVYVSAEGADFARDFGGCAVQGIEIMVPNNGLVTMQTTLMPSNWYDLDEDNTAYAAPTAGNPIVNNGAQVYLIGADNEPHFARNLKITIETGLQMREMASKPNGVYGGVFAGGEGKRIILEGEVYLDSSDVPDGAIDGSSGIYQWTGEGDDAGALGTEREVSVTVGSAVGGLMHLEMASADLTGRVISSNGFHVLQFRAESVGAGPTVLAVG